MSIHRLCAHRLCAMLLIAGVAAPATAEESRQAIAAGARVRVTAPSFRARPLVGRFVRHDGGALQLAESDGTLSAIPFERVMKLEVSSGSKRHVLEGIFGGAALGVAAAFISIRCPHSGYCEETPGWQKLGAIVFGTAGAGVGAVVGANIRSERWAEVPRTAVRVARVPAGAAVSVTLRF